MNTKKFESQKRGHPSGSCKHQTLAREIAFETAFMFGVPTGNYVCAQCGLPLSVILRGTRR